MQYCAINIEEKLSKFSEHWSPKIIAAMNNYHFKLGKFQGEFIDPCDLKTRQLIAGMKNRTAIAVTIYYKQTLINSCK